MKQRSQSLAYIILLFGFALIFAGFFILIPQEKRHEIFWLDISVACLIYFVNFVNIFGLIGVYFDFNKQIAGLGIRIVYIRLYTIFAIAVAVICHFNHVDFKYQLYLQLVGIFFLAITFFITQLATGKAISVAEEQAGERKSKDEILNAINQFEILFSGDSAKWTAEKKRIDFLKEEVRYLSPTNNQNATQTDYEIANAISQAFAVAKNKNESDAEIFSLLNKCEELIKLRKRTYSN